MLKEMTRSGVIQAWFTVTLAIVAGVVLGPSATLTTGALLLALSLAPPMVLMLWPEAQLATAADVVDRPVRRG